MTDTKSTPAASVTVAQVIAALQSLGVAVPIANEDSPKTEPKAEAPSTPPTISARIASPWVLTAVIPQTTSDLDATQSKLAEPTVSPVSSHGDPNPGFVCQYCHQFNAHKSLGDTWYSVTAGRQVGVFREWVQPLVSGVSHASYRRYPSEAVATAAFEDAQAQGLVRILC